MGEVKVVAIHPPVETGRVLATEQLNRSKIYLILNWQCQENKVRFEPECRCPPPAPRFFRKKSVQRRIRGFILKGGDYF
ncbi:hypothetical protein AKJ37_07885 [candidate division MSBL1 archaeon SCGC-AAA259I09]|uniref:Uncharacterized protein n=1 Tax=candidate division MSBL1 archaeon SCGC-AAA259I09 TaxID=1698267 RepID=A0A133UJ08_9EURY|nr:hypothetical protein AKJ37_07885 [candidate division MSBL1 archaeon SCGC-AAA259I09]